MNKNQAIDSLRALAICAVMLFHCGAPLLQAGWLGVDLFFVISGFLITTLLLREHRAYGEVSLRLFWARRFLRLMPIYVLYVVALALAMAWGPSSNLPQGGWATTKYVFGLLVYLGNYVQNEEVWVHQHLSRHLWSLSVEEQFYFIWPLLFGFLVRRRFVEAVAWALVICVVANNALSAAPQAFYLHTRGVGILVGCAVAATFHVRSAWLRNTGLISERSTFAALLATLGVIAAIPYVCFTEESSNLRLTIPLFSLMAAWLVLNLWDRPEGGIASILSRGPLPWIGAISYGAYLYHMLIWELVWSVLLADIEHWNQITKFGLRVSLYLSLTFAVAWGSYRWIETPFLRHKERFRRRAEEATPVLVGEARAA